jgi:glycosyltransferase involved in cell wall biosynthesis
MDRNPDQEALKAQFGVARRRLLLTFGLLSSKKGIETVIRALPAVVRDFPDLIYFVVGATHPAVRGKGRGLSNDARAGGREARRTRARRVSRPVRIGGRAA